MLRTPEQAAEALCPLSRTFGAKDAVKGCRGPECMPWRWQEIMAGHPRWKAAVHTEAEKTGEKAPFAKAARVVADNPKAHGLVPEKGFCGIGGEP